MLAVTGVFKDGERLKGVQHVCSAVQYVNQLECKIYNTACWYNMNDLTIQLLNFDTNTLTKVNGCEFYDNFWIWRLFREYCSGAEYKLALVFSPLLLVLNKYVKWYCLDEDKDVWVWYHLNELCNDLQNIDYKVGRKWVYLNNSDIKMKMEFKGDKTNFERDLAKCKLLFGNGITWR